jgi:hypothetical protein
LELLKAQDASSLLAIDSTRTNARIPSIRIVKIEDGDAKGDLSGLVQVEMDTFNTSLPSFSFDLSSTADELEALLTSYGGVFDGVHVESIDMGLSEETDSTSAFGWQLTFSKVVGNVPLPTLNTSTLSCSVPSYKPQGFVSALVEGTQKGKLTVDVACSGRTISASTDFWYLHFMDEVATFKGIVSENEIEARLEAFDSLYDVDVFKSPPMSEYDDGARYTIQVNDLPLVLINPDDGSIPIFSIHGRYDDGSSNEAFGFGCSSGSLLNITDQQEANLKPIEGWMVLSVDNRTTSSPVSTFITPRELKHILEDELHLGDVLIERGSLGYGGYQWNVTFAEKVDTFLSPLQIDSFFSLSSLGDSSSISNGHVLVDHTVGRGSLDACCLAGSF